MEGFDNIFIIQLVYVALYSAITLFGVALLKSSHGKAGLTPESPATSFAIIAAITVGAFAMRLREEQVVLVYGAVMLVLWARLIALGLGYNVMNYFVFKANLRKAREIYRDTGKKSDLGVPGYTSLNTLMLAVLIHIYGFFALGSGVYYAFIGLPSSDAAELKIKW